MPSLSQQSIVRRLALTVLFVVGFQFSANMAFAGVVIQAPVGLQPGDHFRIIFVTSGTTAATSNNIADYNSFVNQQAGGATYDGRLVQWSAIASTNTVNALANINSASSSAVYMVDGTKVASSTTGSAGGLWSSNLIAQPTEGINGNAFTSGFVWTGTSGNGMEYSTTIFGGYGLGSNNYGYNPYSQMNVFSNPQVQVGAISGSQTGSNWVQIPNNSASSTPGLKNWTDQYQMYGISQEMTVTPEPSTLLISAAGLLVIVLARRWFNRGAVAG